MHNLKIDFIIPWVDGSDSKWQQEFQKYIDIEKDISFDISNKRYRDWGLLKYWFRGVELNATWVNKIHFVTMGQIPEWLNTEHPKLNIVNHKDFIEEKNLPLFNINPIEINLHKIKGLSEHFVYFNDDVYLINKSNPEHFFKNNLPCDSAVLTAYDGVGFSRIQLNNISIINKYFKKNIVIKKDPLKWFNPKYGFELIRNFFLTPWVNFTGFYDYHLTNSFCKSTFIELWNEEGKLLNTISSSRFRDLNNDLTQNIFRFWQLAKGNFYPINKHKLGDYIMLGIVKNNLAIKKLKNSKKPLIVLNDHEPDNLDSLIENLILIFDEKFPEKSKFER